MLKFIEKHSSFLIAGHKNPDGDCAGSQVALAHFLTRIGKEAIPISEGPLERLEIKRFKESFITDFTQIEDINKYAVIILDVSSLARIGFADEKIKDLEILIIDHHSSAEPFGKCWWIEPTAPSTTYLVFLLIEAMGYKPDMFEADALLLGLCTDTGFFRHIDAGGAEILKVASRMTEPGIPLKQIFQDMYSGVELGDRKLLATILLRAEELYEGRLLFTWITRKDKKNIFSGYLKTDEVYRLLQAVDGVELVILIKEEEDCFSVSFRSNGVVMVDQLAGKLGGGGHQLASGCEISGTFSEIKKRVLDEVEKILNPA